MWRVYATPNLTYSHAKKPLPTVEVFSEKAAAEERKRQWQEKGFVACVEPVVIGKKKSR